MKWVAKWNGGKAVIITRGAQQIYNDLAIISTAPTGDEKGYQTLAVLNIGDTYPETGDRLRVVETGETYTIIRREEIALTATDAPYYQVELTQ